MLPLSPWPLGKHVPCPPLHWAPEFTDRSLFYTRLNLTLSKKVCCSTFQVFCNCLRSLLLTQMTATQPRSEVETLRKPTCILQLVLPCFPNAFKLRSPSLSLCAVTAECQLLKVPFCKIQPFPQQSWREVLAEAGILPAKASLHTCLLMYQQTWAASPPLLPKRTSWDLVFY